ncbi:MAG: hypothetical protein RLY34_926 [Actinomycetota bacterium]|jgi:hypothetical protein
MPLDVVIAKRVGVSRKKLFLVLFRLILGPHFGLHLGVDLALF